MRIQPALSLSLLAISVLSGLGSGCWRDGRVGDPANPNPRRTQIGIRIGQEIVLDELRSTLRFEGVSEDSRCPVDAVCIWEGNARVQLRLRDDAGQETSFWLDTSRGRPEHQARFVYSDHELSVDRLLPQPQANVETDPGSYELFLTIAPVGP